jgi:hypothetical protein
MPVGVFLVGSVDRFDEWQHRLTLAVNESSDCRVTGSLYDATTQPFIHIRVVQDADVQELVQVLLLQDGQAFVRVEAEEVHCERLLEVVSEACRTASAGMGGTQEFGWTVIVSPAPESEYSGTPRLRSAGDIGEVHIESSDQPMSEPALGAAGRPHLGSSQWQWSVPMRFTGKSRGWSHASATTVGARDLAILCSMLTVAWNVCIVPRTSLLPNELGGASVPPSLFPGEWSAGLETYPFNDLELPVWRNTAWALVQKKPWLGHSLVAFREGLRAESNHPSLALVALMASIESIAARLFTTAKCATCETRLNVSAGFRAAVALALDDPEDIALVQRAYGPRRSKTVHEGRLHSHEFLEGAWFGGGWGGDAELDFRRLLWRARKAARALLLLALQDNLPAKRSLTADELSG